MVYLEQGYRASIYEQFPLTVAPASIVRHPEEVHRLVSDLAWAVSQASDEQRQRARREDT